MVSLMARSPVDLVAPSFSPAGFVGYKAVLGPQIRDEASPWMVPHFSWFLVKSDGAFLVSMLDC